MKVLNVLLIASILLIGINTSAQSQQELTEKFNIIDADKNEVITVIEMNRYYKDSVNEYSVAVNARKLFYGLDGNSNRIITLKEYLNGLNLDLAYKHSDKWQIKPYEKDRLVSKELTATKKAARFREFDKDRSKGLSVEEIINYFNNNKNQLENSNISPKLKFYAYDANEDGKIVYAEFVLEPNWQKGFKKIKNLELAEF